MTIDQTRILPGILLLIVFGHILFARLLRITLADPLAPDEVLTLGIAGWLLPASFLSMVWFVFGFEITVALTLILTLSLLLRPRLRPSPQPAPPNLTFSLLTILLISLPLRLVFVSRVVLPSYFDSAQHYLIIKQLIEHNAEAGRYYHTGFHILTAFIASAFHAPIAPTMLILGQVILAVMPFALYPIIKHETRSSGAGIFALLLAACGWYMPAHAVNWGKYPALMSVGLIPFVLGIVHFMSKQVTVTRFAKAAVTLLGIAIAVFAHSRALIIFGIAFLAWIISSRREKLPHTQRFIVLIVVLLVIVTEIFLVQKQAILALVFDPYFNHGVLITTLALLLSIFAHTEYPRVAFASVVSVCLLLAGLFIPLTIIPGYSDLTLLDRPYVEMILFLPLSLLGGLGLAGVSKIIESKYPKPRFINMFVIGIILVNGVVAYNWHPSDCCVIAGDDDIAAIDWLDGKILPDARVGIASTHLKVLASDSFEGVAGSDAGVWITPLTGRVTVALPNLTEFDQRATHEMLCEMNVDYLYVGGKGQAFNDTQLQRRPEWYRVMLSMPRVRVYKVIGC